MPLKRLWPAKDDVMTFLKDSRVGNTKPLDIFVRVMVYSSATEMCRSSTGESGRMTNVASTLANRKSLNHGLLITNRLIVMTHPALCGTWLFPRLRDGAFGLPIKIFAHWRSSFETCLPSLPAVSAYVIMNTNQLASIPMTASILIVCVIDMLETDIIRSFYFISSTVISTSL